MIKLFILGVLILAGKPAWGDVTAWVNKNPVVVGDMFQLHVEAKNVYDAEEPDLSGITRFANFESKCAKSNLHRWDFYHKNFELDLYYDCSIFRRLPDTSPQGRK